MLRLLHPSGLIIIDTLKRVREAGGADYSYASDYDIVARLKKGRFPFGADHQSAAAVYQIPYHKVPP